MRNRTAVLVIVLWLVLAAAALALSILAAANDTLPGDKALTEWLQGQRLPGQDLCDFVRAITTTEVVMATGAAVTLILWLKGYRQQAVLLGAGLVALAIMQFGVKEIVDRPRPDAELVDVRAGRTSPSFPAGHVMSGTYLYGSLIYFALTLPMGRAATVALAFASALVIALAGPVNVWLGAHWPSDVLGGYLLASVILTSLLIVDTWRRGPASLPEP